MTERATVAAGRPHVGATICWEAFPQQQEGSQQALMRDTPPCARCWGLRPQPLDAHFSEEQI